MLGDAPESNLHADETPFLQTTFKDFKHEHLSEDVRTFGIQNIESIDVI